LGGGELSGMVKVELTSACRRGADAAMTRTPRTRSISVLGSASPRCCNLGLGHEPPPHVPMIVPGHLARRHTRWIAAKPSFFLPVLVLSKLFRRLRDLVAAHEAGKLAFFGVHAHLAEKKAFAAFLAPLKRTRWFIYSKRPFAGPRAVLAYRDGIGAGNLDWEQGAAPPDAGRDSHAALAAMELVQRVCSSAWATSQPQMPVHQRGVGQQGRGGALKDHLALDEDHDAVGHRGHRRDALIDDQRREAGGPQLP
jgi:hypothetical protein